MCTKHKKRRESTYWCCVCKAGLYLDEHFKIYHTNFKYWVVELFTRQCHLKGHLFKLGLTDDPTCERCLGETESATHILYDCEATAYLRFCHLGQFFMEPSDYYDAPINQVLHFIRSVGLIKG
jgi:hypothetical protein